MRDTRLRQFWEVVNRTVAFVKRPVSGTADITPDAAPVKTGELESGERRRRIRRRRPERRRSDDAASLVELPRVLLIDPDPNSRLLHACLLEEAGYAVYAAGRGREAVDVAQARLPDVVVLECPLPHDDGAEILRRLREHPATCTIPIVVMTSSFHFEGPARGRASAAMSVIGKPLSPESLLAEVDELLRATPRERLVVRKLKRSLLTLRDIGTRVGPEDHGQERMRLLIDRLQVAMLALDAEGTCVAVSRGASTLTGYSRNELLGKSIFETAFAPNPSASERWRELLAQPQAAIETVMRDKNGETVTVQTESAMILPGLQATAFADGGMAHTAGPA